MVVSILGAVLAGVGVVALQTEYVRREFIKATKKEFVKYLPQIAEEQWHPIYEAVKECFDAYERQVNYRVNGDINSRKAELDNLLRQKESHEIDREAETQPLKNMEMEILSQVRQIESVSASF